MTININGLDINYVNYGNKKGKTVVLLHGWGQNIAMMDPIGQGLKDLYNVIILDLPGFGASSEPNTPYTIEDYYQVLDKLLKKLKVTDPILVGHSFGGRVAVYYASCNKVSKLVLFGAPFIKRVTNPTLKMKVLKKLKKMPGLNKLGEKAKKYIGSRDYKAASPIMRETLVNIVNCDLTDNVKKIKCSCIAIAGEKDEEVSLDEMMLYKEYISDCEVIVYPNMTHYAYLEDKVRTINILRSFFGGK